MISGRKRGFCPKPLRSPDPDHHNRSVIVCTKSPDVKQPEPPARTADFNLLTHEIAALRRENQQLRAQLAANGRHAEEAEAVRLRAISREKDEQLSNSRTRLERTKESTEQLRRQMEEMRQASQNTARLLESKDAEIRSLEDMIKRIRTEPDPNRELSRRLKELELENSKLRESIGDNPMGVASEQNFLLLKRIDDLIGENESLKDLLAQFDKGESSRIRELKENERELRLELARIAREGQTPKKEAKSERPLNQETIDRIKQHFEKEMQLWRNRLYELREQLAQAQDRVQKTERRVTQMSARVKHQKHQSTSANPERTYKDYSPIARGDSGVVVDRMDEDEPHISKFSEESAQRSRVQVLHEGLTRRLEQQEHYAEELLKANRSKDSQFANLTQALREKDTEINGLRNTNRIVEERASILRNQLEERQQLLQTKMFELEELRKNIPPSREREIEQLKRELQELRAIIESGRPQHASNAEINRLKAYIVELNQTLDAERGRRIKLEAENEELRNAVSANFNKLVSGSNEELNRLRQENREFRQCVEDLRRQNQLMNISVSAVKSTGSTQVDKMSFLNSEITSLRETVQHLRKANSELQDELRRCDSMKVEMSFKLNHLVTENQAVGLTIGQLRERQSFLERQLSVKNAEIDDLRGRLHEATKSLSGSAAKANEEKTRLQDLLQLEVAQNAGLKQQLAEFERFKKEYQMIRTSEQRKGTQLEEALKEMAECKDLLSSVNFDDIEVKAKESRVQNIQVRSKERVIKISIQKEGLKWEVERLKQHVVSLADEVARLAHEREVLQAQVSRVSQDREIQSRRTRQLSEVIRKYIETKWDDSRQKAPSIRPLEEEIARQLQELDWPTDLSSLKVSLKRMEQSVERIRNHLQQFVHAESA